MKPLKTWECLVVGCGACGKSWSTGETPTCKCVEATA